MDEVRKLVTDKLAEKGLTMKDGSLAMGRAHTFLYQFLKRGIPAEIHERDRPKLAAILGVPADALRGPGKPVPPSLNGGSPVTGAEAFNNGEGKPIGRTPTQYDRARVYELALRKIVTEQPNSAAAKIAAAALLLFE